MTNQGSGSGRLDNWLSSVEVNDGMQVVSKARHFGDLESGEDEYAEQFVVDEAYEAALGSGLAETLERVQADKTGPALEIGAGTGIFSRALVANGGYPAYFISDMSPRFLKLTRDSLNGPPNNDPVDFVVLSSEDIGLWPEETLSLVALRFVLHHVLDWERFIHQAAGLLRPGGVLLIEEPCADGYLLQAAMANMARRSPTLAEEMTPAVGKDVDFFVDTTLWYPRTGVDKQLSEDKHVFQLNHLLRTFEDAGLEPTFFQNRGFENAVDGESLPGEYFAEEFRHNLAINFGFGKETMDYFERHLAPTCRDLSLVDGEVNGPVVRGVVAGQRAHSRRRLWAPAPNAALKTRAVRLGRAAGRGLPAMVKDRVPDRVREKLKDPGA